MTVFKSVGQTKDLTQVREVSECYEKHLFKAGFPSFVWFSWRNMLIMTKIWALVSFISIPNKPNMNLESVSLMTLTDIWRKNKSFFTQTWMPQLTNSIYFIYHYIINVCGVFFLISWLGDCLFDPNTLKCQIIMNNSCCIKYKVTF